MGTEHGPGAIITGEYDQCIFSNACVLHGLHQLTYRPIDFFNNIPIATTTTASLKLPGCKNGRVWHVMRQVKKEWPFTFLRDPLHRCLGIAFGKQFLIHGKFNHLPTLDQWNLKCKSVANIKHIPRLFFPLRCWHIIATGRSQVLIKATFQRMHRRLGKITGIPRKVPFTKHRRIITVHFQHRWHHKIASLNKIGASHERRMPARHQTTSTWYTRGPRSIKTCPTLPLFGKPINVRSLVNTIAITSQITVTQVINKNQDDVRLPGIAGCSHEKS